MHEFLNSINQTRFGKKNYNNLIKSTNYYYLSLSHIYVCVCIKTHLYTLLTNKHFLYSFLFMK